MSYKAKAEKKKAWTRLPKPMFMEKLKLKTEEKWNDILKELVKTTDNIFLEADQHIIEQGKRDMSGMYTIMSGNVKVLV